MHLILPGIGFLLLLVILFLSGDGDCSQFEASLSLDNSTAEADVRPGEHGITYFTGILTCNVTGVGQNTQTIIVKLTARTDDWAASVLPDDIEIEPDEDKTVPFSVSVRVPNHTSSTETREVVISGSATLEPGGQTYPIEPVTGTVSVKKYNLISVSCNEPYKQIDGGETVYFFLDITNEGNAECAITITINNLEELREYGFEIEMSDSTMTLNEKDVVMIKITVKTPEKNNEVFRIDVTIRSDSSEDMDREDVSYYTFFVRVVMSGDTVCTSYFWAIISFVGFILIMIIGWHFLSKRKKKKKG